jgi:hypothetical protein
MFACTPTIENSLGTPHTGHYRNHIDWAVLGTSTTLHAGVPVVDNGLVILHGKNRMGADFQATPTANTFTGIEG